MDIISRETAKGQGLTRYFSGEPCKFGHIAPRTIRDTKCVTCTLNRQNEKRAQARAEAFPDGRDPWKKCEPGHKVCRKCRETKPESGFSRDRRASDGLQTQCLECQAEANSRRYNRDLEKSRARNREYYAKNSQAFSAWAKGFRERHRESIAVSKKAYYDRIKLDPEWQKRELAARMAKKAIKSAYDRGYRARNPDIVRQRANAWRQRNPEKRASIMKAYSARRRSQEAGGDSTAAIHAWEMAAKKVCYWCHKPCADKYHLDHYEPLARGGKHVIANLVISCPTCNLKKNAKDPYAFAASLGRLF